MNWISVHFLEGRHGLGFKVLSQTVEFEVLPEQRQGDGAEQNPVHQLSDCV